MFEKKLNLIKLVLENEIIQSEATIISDFEEAIGIVTVKSHLYSIIFNLLSNALKYRLKDVPLIIKLKSYTEGEYICLSVRDNGMGLDLLKYKDKIFGLYKRFHEKTIPGKGIGLNLIKAQVESLGGYITLESKVNNGAEFKVFIPKKYENGII